MRNITSQKLRIIFLLGLLLTCLTAIAQTPVPPGFSARLAGGNIKVKGDVIFVGNNILNRSPNPNTGYDGNTDNNGQTMEYIDIDGDPTTRNSSSADLTLTTCDRVVYAGLYWASTYPYERSTDNGSEWNPSDANRYSDFNQIKFKLPTGGYIDITGSILFDGRATVLNQSFKDAPAICYYDVTSLVQGLTNPTGTYTVANMRSSKGQRSGSSSAGWVMVVIYENPTLPSKFISTYDGYKGISSGNTDIAINGFVTLPAPNPVNARLGVGALEGDKGITNDKLQFKGNLTAGFTDIGNTLNPTNNFFNSTITNNDAQVPGRNPYGQNTLGLDLDMLPINNPSNNVIKNNETGATLRLTSSGDGFGAFLATFAVDIIEPNIKLVKKVRNSAGQDISGQNVTLSSVLDYVLTFDNIGNDDAQNFVLTDILPVNTSFVSLSMPTVTAAGGTYSYNAATHTVTINVPNSLVKKDILSAEHTITIRVQVASSCNELTDACSSIILNTATSTYQGVINTAIISNNPSASGLTSCGAPITGPANFLVDVSACVYSRTEVICNGQLVLTGADGYGTYTWYKENGATDIPMGNTKTITVYDTGEYYYDATPIAPCIVPIRETVFVTDFLNSTMTNPVIPVADATPICPNNGTVLPKIYLCGSNDSQFIPTGITTGVVRWQKLNSTCATVVPLDCPHNACPASAWDTVFTGPNYTATTAGEYRIYFDPNGTGSCPMYFYFNVYKNNFDPQITVKDKICNTNGEIQVVNAPSNYEIRLINQTTNAVIVDYPNTTPVFSNVAPGAYIVEIKQTGVVNGCTFRVANITVLNRTITGTVITTGKTCNLPGSVTIQATGVNPQYSYTLTGSGVSLTHGPDTSSTHTFSGLNPGTYTVTVTTQDGCTFSSPATVADLSTLSLNAVVSQHISCNQGNIQMNGSGGKTPYSYAIYSYNGVLQNPTPANYQTSVIFDIPLGMQGDYVFIMTDANNCTALSNLVTINLVPDVVFTSNIQNVLCNGQANGSISLNVTNANGYNVSFDLLNNSGTVIATNTSGVFTGLAPGDYTVVLHQTKGNRSCDFSFPYTITQPTAITAGAPTVTQQYTCSTTGTIFIDPAGISGGTAPYTYSINGTTYGASSTFTGLTAGTYTVRVKDASGCVLNATPITIPALTPPTDLAFAATPISCSAPTSTVTLTTTGGSGALNYQITAPSTVNNGTSNVFAGLAPGTYTFRVTDAKGCSYQENYTINSITPISVVGVKVNDVRCFGSATGALTYTVGGFTPNYNYTVASTGTAVPSATGVTSGTINLTNLAAGTYTITVTNPTTGCTATAAVTIANPTAALAVTKTVVQPDCTVTTGSLAVTATNGWGGYSYALTGQAAIGPQASPNFTGLAAGNYTLTVTDANGCIFTDTFTITAPVAPVLAVTGFDVCLPGTSITVAVNAGTGLAPFQFSINGGAYTNGTVANGTTYTNLPAGTYTITVRDANGCTNAAAVTRTINAQLTATTTLVKGLTCTAPAAAQIGVIINGGGASYQYQVSYNGGAYSAATTVAGSFTYNAAAAGTYQFQITDAAGCIVTTAVRTIAPITTPQFTFGTTTAVKCFGDSTGALTININPGFGTAPYTVAVTNTTTGVSYGSQTTLLAAGNYSVTITDANGCIVTNTTSISQPTAPIAYAVTTKDITCNNPNTSFGEITVQGVTGGTAPYTYYVTNNFGTNLTPYVATTGQDHTFIVVNFGIYTVNVVDANGCSLIKTNYVIASPPNDLTIDVSTPTANCVTGGTVVVTVTAAVLSNNYEFGILTQNTPPYSTAYQSYDAGTPTIKTFTGLTPGVTYTFVVHDLVTNCYYFKTATGPVPTLSTITATATATPVTCTGAADGKVSFTVNGYSATTTEIDYQIFHYPSTLPVTPTPITGTLTGLTGTPATVNNVGNLAPGDYYILFTEVDGSVMGCSKTSPVFTITESTLLLQASAVVTKNDNCNTNAGIITASALYGTAPYSYQLVPAASPAPTAGTWAGQASPIFNAEGGTYIVYVKDANNCIQPTPVTIVLPTDVSPALTAVLAPGTQCTTAEGNFVIDVTRTNNGSLGPFQYSLDGGAFEPQADTFSYTGLASGTHTIQIQDINGCTMATAFTVPVYAPIDVTAQPTVQPTCPANVGTITAAGTGGSAPANLRYELQTAAGVSVAGPQASAVFTGIAAGSYKVVISDTATPCTAEAPVTLDATVPVTFSTTKDDVNCLGGTDGSITIILPNTNTDIPYTYTIDGASSPAVTQSQPVFTSLSADTYVVTVTSGKGCTATQNVTITAPAAVVAGATVTTPFACAPDNTVNTATVTVTGTGGTPGYTYSIDGTNYTSANTFAVASTGAVQNIIAYVKDSNGCIDDVPLTINPMPVITSATAVLTTAIECDDNTGVITVTAAGGSGDFTFTMLPSGTPVNTLAGDYDQTFSINSPGLYTFRITDDVTGCYTIVSAAEVMPYNIIDATATASVPVVCFGSSTGTITVDVQDYTGAYSYQVYNGATVVATGTGNTTTNPYTITGLPAGNLFVRITETATPFCSADTSIITVDSPADPLVPNAAMTADVTCTNNMGEIVAQATGGWGTYEYELVNNTTSTTIQLYAANNTFTGLAAGSYTVFVRDSGGCIASQNITLTLPAPIAAGISQSVTALLCKGDTTASVQATGVTGGQGTYEYILNTYDAAGTTIVSSTGAQPSPIFTNLGAGIYSITVVDGWDCDLPATATVTITEPAQLVGSLSLTKTLTCTTLAEVTISATGGTAPYQYSTDGGTTYNPFSAGTVFSVAAGTYSYLVMDNNGCTAVLTNEVEIAPVPALNLNLDLSAATINCSGGSNAQIVSNATGGLGSYQYSLLNVGTGVTTGPSASGTFSGLSAGTYRLTVNSGDCSATSSDIIITNPTVLASVPTITHIQCYGQATGSISFATTGGTGIVQYAISPNLSQFVDTNVLTQLAAGTYDVVVQDQKGCFLLFNLTVTQPTQIQADITVHSDEACLGSGDGTINVDVWGGSPPYQISTDNFVTYATVPSTGPVTSYLIEDLVPGTTLVWVRDANGCSIFPAMQQVILPGVDMNPQTAVVETCVNNAPNNNVTITITPTANAVGIMEYSIDNVNWFTSASPTSYTFNNVGLAAGTYTAYVRHTLPGVAPVVDLECVQTKPFTIAAHNAIAATAAVTTPIDCNGGTGSITINVTASTGTLQYAVGPAFTFGSSNVFNGLTAGTYDFKVKDVLGCELDITGVVLSQPTAVTASVSALIDEICFGDNDGTFTVTPSGGTPDYQVSIDGGTTFTALSPSPVTFNNRPADDYTVVVKDAKGCIYTLPAPVTIAPGADLQASISPVQVCNVTTVTVSVNPLEAANVTYYLDGVAQPSNVITATGLTAGNHTIDVTHTNGCNANFSFNVAPVIPIVMGATSKTDVSCFGGTNGTATVAVTGGTAPLTYAIAPNVLPLTFGTYQSSNTFTGLAAGSYVINVKDALGCESPSATITVGQPTAALAATATSTNEICINAADGTITVTPANGTGPYQARINGGLYTASFATSTTFNALAPGNYTVDVLDANGCSYTITPAITITPGADLQPSVIVDPYCQNNVIHNIVLISDNVFANIGLVQYAVDGGTPQTGGDFYDLAPGAHTATVLHANGCQETIPFTVPTLLAISPTVSATTNINCFGGATGAITVTATGGTGTLSYAIADADVLPLVFGTPQPTGVFTGLTAGNYVVSILDDNLGCETQVTATLTEPLAALTATTTDTEEICLGANDGSITVTVADGTAPYRARINGGAYTATFTTSHTFNLLTPNTYTVEVIDANGCTYTVPGQVTIAPGVNLQGGVATTQDCNDITITLSANPAIAASALTYTLDGGAPQAYTTTPIVVTGLTAGSHSVIISHSNGCNSAPFTFNVAPIIPITITGTSTTAVSCFGGTTGTATVTATGGTAPLTYAIAPNVLPLVYGPYHSSNTFTGLVAGDYVISVRDAIGCEQPTTVVTVTQPAAALTATLSAQDDEDCLGAGDGTFTVTPAGGTAPYEARINGGAYTAPGTAPIVFSNLVPGTYTVEVRDANGCTYTVPGQVTIAPGVNLQGGVATTQDCNDITITLSANPAIAASALTYTLDGGAPQAYTTTPIVVTGLTAGSHSVIISHSNGCNSAPFTFNVAPIIPITITGTSTTAVSCFGGTTGTATVTATGGTAPLTYAIAPNVLPLVYGPYQSSNTFTGLVAGDYVISVRDAIGCEQPTTVVTVTQPAAALTATLSAQDDEDCLGAGDGTFTVTPAGGTAPYEARINGGAYTAPGTAPIVFSNLVPGTYTVEVRDANGCTYTVPGQVTIAPGVNLQGGVATTQDCNDITITLSANPAIAASALTYTLDGGAPQAYTTTPIVVTGLTAGSHSVIISHSNGCNSAPFTFNVAPIIPITITGTSTTAVSCFGGTTGTATVTATGGAAPLTYAIAPNVLPLVYGPYQSSNTFTGLAAGDYVISVRDAIGCEQPTTVVTVTQPAAALTATLSAQDDEDCLGAGDGTFTVTPAGGTAPYEARINGGAYTAPGTAPIVFSNLVPGTYTVEVRDANGCTYTVPGQVTIAPGVNLQGGVATTQDCNDITITLSANPAVAASALTYTLDGGAPQAYTTTPIVVTGLTAGSHSVIISHSNGCNSAPFTFNVAPIIPITITGTSTTAVSCFGGTTGTATVTATGGTAPLTYAIAPNVLPLVYGPYQSSNTFTGLVAGDYVISVRDAIGCEQPTTVVTITQPVMSLSAITTHTDEQCLGDNNGSVTVTPQGGTAPYTATLNGGAATPTPAAPAGTPIVFSGLSGGNYNIVVTDANGCIFNVPSTTVLTGIVINPQVSYTQECNEVDIVVTVNAAVAGQVTYSLDGGPAQASNEFNDVILNPAVPHTVTVTHVQGCSQDTAPFTIAPVVPIVLNSTNVNVTNVACHGKDVGSIVVNATGGTGPLQYAITWNIWPTQFYGPSNTFNDLLAGDYTVWVKDAMGCVQSLTVTITEPAEELILAAVVGQHESCIGAHDGTIDITLVQGGTPPYSIALDSPNNFQPYDPAATPDFAGLYGRTLPYEIYVRDASGCYAKAIVTIQKGVSLVPNIQTVLSCVNNAPVNTVTATLNTIVDNVEYKLETATGTLIQDFSTVKTWTLAPGNYVYTVRHINGCQKTFAFTVQPRVPITVTSAIPTDAACNGNADGTLTIVATGGTGNLQYGISPDYVMTSNPVFTGLAAGTYTVRVQDQYGCYVDFSNFPPIGEPAVLAMTETMNLPEVCVDDNNGAFEIDITGGTAPYATSLDANGPFVTDQTLFENLDGGTYTVYIQDAKGCTMTQDVILISPLDIDAKAEVVYNCDQNTVTITTNGAINPGELNYTIVGPKDGNNPPQTSNIFANLEDGTYTVEVINTVTGCTDVTAPFNIISVPDLALSLSMSGLNQFTATVMGGEGPYQYTLDGDSNGSKNVFTYFRSGIYVVTVTDARGCTREARIEVNFVDIILPDVVTPDDDGQNDTWAPGNTTNYPKINSFVFDRYGRKLATLRQGDTWDGTYNGNPMPTGDYWYLIELNDADGRSFVGHFTIYR